MRVCLFLILISAREMRWVPSIVRSTPTLASSALLFDCNYKTSAQNSIQQRHRNIIQERKSGTYGRKEA